MIVRDPGRVYLLRNFSSGYQELAFTRKRYDGTFADGTTVEELLRVLRDKFYHFNSVNPSEQNVECITHLDVCLELCLSRLNVKRETLRDKEGDTNKTM